MAYRRHLLQQRPDLEACLRALPLCDSLEFAWLEKALEKPWDNYTGHACWGSLCQGPDSDVGRDVDDDNRVDFHGLVAWLPPCAGPQPGAGLQLLHQTQWDHSLLVLGPPPCSATQARMPQTNWSTVNKFTTGVSAWPRITSNHLAAQFACHVRNHR